MWGRGDLYNRKRLGTRHQAAAAQRTLVCPAATGVLVDLHDMLILEAITALSGSERPCASTVAHPPVLSHGVDEDYAVGASVA
jgi:hypothetical protein